MDQGPATRFPDGPAKAMKSEAGKKGQDTAAGSKFEQVSGSGTQKSLNPKKSGHPKTMRFLR